MIKPNTDLRQVCRICVHETKHQLIYQKEITKELEYSPQEVEQYGSYYRYVQTFSLIQCKGCEDIRLHILAQDDFHGARSHRESLYPSQRRRSAPDWVAADLHSLPRLALKPEKDPYVGAIVGEIRDFLHEIYQAFDGGLFRVAMMGIRALIECIMVHECGDRGSFKKNCEAFFEKGLVAPSQQKMFADALLEAGHAAMHRGWAPTQGDVETLLGVVEALIKSLYIDPSKTEKIAQSLPAPAWKAKRGRAAES